eukprot:TRINITY_DN833_c0_g1_i1.p1 TRINITY_DN833_c0_g1~~TRINITY_DN833_c0_g1_i1.p1  ORF type:complete len:449 (+),score=101.80 TRINITY_DN833_c0_g1_i1:63-1409(+)
MVSTLFIKKIKKNWMIGRNLIFFVVLLLLFSTVPIYSQNRLISLDSISRFGECSEEYVRQFSLNEVAEINCNGTLLQSIADINGVRFLEESNTIILPFLQQSARTSLLRIINNSLRTVTVLDAYRSLSLAFLRIEQRKHGICDGEAPYFDRASTTGFDSGLGLKFVTDPLITPYFIDEGWTIQEGENDTTIAIYNILGQVKDIRYLSILLFQRHWNLDNDMNSIPETGVVDMPTYKSLSLYNISGYRHTCPKDSLILEPNKNVRFMLVMLVPIFFLFIVLLIWFAVVHVEHKDDNYYPLVSKKRFHLDPTIKGTPHTELEEFFRPQVRSVAFVDEPPQDVKENSDENKGQVGLKPKKKFQDYSLTTTDSVDQEEYENEDEEEFLYEYEEDEDEDEERYEWEDLDEDEDRQFFGEGDEDEYEYTFEEEEEGEDGEGETDWVDEDSSSRG